MRSRRGFEDKFVDNSHESKKTAKAGSNVKKIKFYAVLLVSLIGILTIFWMYSFSYYKNKPSTTTTTTTHQVQNQNNKYVPTQPTFQPITEQQQQQQQQQQEEEEKQEQQFIPPPFEPQNDNEEDTDKNIDNNNVENDNNAIDNNENDNENDNNNNNNNDNANDNNEIDNNNDKNDNANAIDDEPLPDEEIYLSKIIKAGKRASDNDCVHKPKRNYQKYPVNVYGHSASKEILDACDIPCVYNRGDLNYADASLSGPSGCGHTSRISFSMESVVNYPSLKYETIHSTGYDIAATYELDSDVPLPYFSWAEYNLRQKPKKKTAKAMVAMFVSNCGASNNRLEYVRELMANGITVDSFGRCMHNADATVSSSNYNDVKGETIARYKFTIAMENSNTKDYVTEKLYTPLSWGTVPIHMGLANIHDYAPEHSVISVHDFASPKELAAYLKELDRNDTKYEEYLAWKEKPYTKSFKALVDVSNVHSACRMCIKAADINRMKYGAEERPENLPTFTKKMMAENEGALPLWVRERGKYWPLPVFVKERTVEALKKAALDVLRPVGTAGRKGETTVWGMYDRYTRITKEAYIVDDDVVKEMHPFTELEIVIVD